MTRISLVKRTDTGRPDLPYPHDRHDWSSHPLGSSCCVVPKELAIMISSPRDIQADTQHQPGCVEKEIHNRNGLCVLLEKMQRAYQNTPVRYRSGVLSEENRFGPTSDSELGPPESQPCASIGVNHGLQFAFGGLRPKANFRNPAPKPK